MNIPVEVPYFSYATPQSIAESPYLAHLVWLESAVVAVTVAAPR